MIIVEIQEPVRVPGHIYAKLPCHERLEVVPFATCAVCGCEVAPWQFGLCDACEKRIDDREWAPHMLGGDDR